MLYPSDQNTTPLDVQLAMRDAGQYAPNTWQAQVQAKNSIWDQAAAQNAAQQQQGHIQQQQQINQSFPLPTPGQSPALSPVMQANMAQQGFTDPNAYVLNQRLGNNKYAVNMPKSLNGQSSIDPQALLNDPTFQPWLKSQPQKAGQIFQALTGKPLFSQDKENPGFMDQQLQQQVEQRQSSIKAMQGALENQDAKQMPDGSIAWRQMIPNPGGMGGFVAGPNYGPGTAYQKTLETYLPQASPQLAAFQKQANSPQRQAYLASLQPPTEAQSSPTQAPQGMQTSPITGHGALGVLGNTLDGSMNDVTNILTGKPQVFAGGDQSRGFFAPAGSAVQHAAPQLRNNSQFQQFLRTNPEAARRIILAIQQGGLQ